MIRLGSAEQGGALAVPARNGEHCVHNVLLLHPHPLHQIRRALDVRACMRTMMCTRLVPADLLRPGVANARSSGRALWVRRGGGGGHAGFLGGPAVLCQPC